MDENKKEILKYECFTKYTFTSKIKKVVISLENAFFFINWVSVDDLITLNHRF